MSLVSLGDIIPNKTSFSKSFCSLRSNFQTAIYDTSKFFLVLAFFGAFEMTVHLKHWLMLLQRCFDDSELLVGLLCSFYLTSAFFLYFISLYCF